jgi:hypothetical protein
MSLNLTDLEAAVSRMTPGPWMDNQHYECAHTHNALVGLRPVYHYSHNNPNAATDSAGLVALRNAAPELIAAARERDELAGLLRRVLAAKVYLGGKLTDDIEAALAKVGPS